LVHLQIKMTKFNFSGANIIYYTMGVLLAGVGVAGVTWYYQTKRKERTGLTSGRQMEATIQNVKSAKDQLNKDK
jgi:hypothetical protein